MDKATLLRSPIKQRYKIMIYVLFWWKTKFVIFYFNSDLDILIQLLQLLKGFSMSNIFFVLLRFSVLIFSSKS